MKQKLDEFYRIGDGFPLPMRFFLKVLANSTKVCYNYDDLSRVTSRTIKNSDTDEVISTETFTYDAAGNITTAPNSSCTYDINNRLTVFNGQNVNYDADGNMLSCGANTFAYDSANRLISADGHTYIYNAENVRIRNLCTDEDTIYTYNTNCKLGQLLMKTTNDVVTKYVYGIGLIGEDTNNTFKTYHFDNRGSTIAITDESGNVTDTLAYDTYGKQIDHVGESNIIFGYNGMYGVVTESNGLLYMRARYYSPAMKRFVNADVVHGSITNAITLNRYAYANGNPVSNFDPFGLWSIRGAFKKAKEWIEDKVEDIGEALEEVGEAIVEHVVKPVAKAAKKTVDYIANDLGEDIVEHVVEPAKEFIEEKIVSPVKEGVEEASKWLNNADNWLNENALNKDGSLSIYDNNRLEGKKSFHEQLLAINSSGSGLDIDAKDGSVGIGGTAEVDVYTGGWEGKYLDFSLFDFGHAELTAEYSTSGKSVGAMASIWSPSLSISFGGVKLELGAEVGAVGFSGGKSVDSISLGFAAGFGGSVKLSW